MNSLTEHFLCHEKAISEGKPRAFSIDLAEGKFDLFLVKYDQAIYAYKNQCPHLAIPLNWQQDAFLSLAHTHIQCSTHGALFNINNGHCIAGPCAGDQLTSLPLEQRDNGELWIYSDTIIFRQ